MAKMGVQEWIETFGEADDNEDKLRQSVRDLVGELSMRELALLVDYIKYDLLKEP